MPTQQEAPWTSLCGFDVEARGGAGAQGGGPQVSPGPLSSGAFVGRAGRERKAGHIRGEGMPCPQRVCWGGAWPKT